MNFSESLDKFILNGADRRSKMQNSSGCEHMDKAISRLLKIGYEDCAASLKPIVLKLVEAINEHHLIWNDSGCTLECSSLCRTLAEVGSMIEEGK